MFPRFVDDVQVEKELSGTYLDVGMVLVVNSQVALLLSRSFE